jgi:hypothetical protein
MENTEKFKHTICFLKLKNLKVLKNFKILIILITLILNTLK